MVIVFNNGGIYGGDRRQPALQEAAKAGAAKGNFSADPVPTAFVNDARCARHAVLTHRGDCGGAVTLLYMHAVVNDARSAHCAVILKKDAVVP